MKVLRKIANFLFSRLFIVGLMLVLQVALFVWIILQFSSSSVYIYLVLHVISAVAAVWLISNDGPPEFKITWLVFVLSFPVVGGLFYLLLGNLRIPKKTQRQIEETSVDMETLLPPTGLLPENPYNRLHAQYVSSITQYPVYDDSVYEYYPVGEDMFRRMMEEMENAERYICLEFFIVKPGRMLTEMLELLQRKIQQGVEVFFMYDDLGTIFNLPKQYKQKIKDIGIEVCVFNRFRPHVSTILNHRDHRKIVLIDGKAAFTGGINIADEYINEKERFGHWKDTGVLVLGPAAWAFGIMFFELWQFSGGRPLTIEHYAPTEHYQVEGDGMVQIFPDTPMDDHNVTEMVYLKAIQQAKDYIYIATPYLVIDYAMQEALCTTAQSGVDVRLLVPHIYDKWYVHTLTTSHYRHLIENGVKIYEYSPGFLHGKMFVADDRVGVVGTCNMDFRSFYLHFECSVLFYESQLLFDIKEDLIESQNVSQEITLKDVENTPLRLRVLQYLLKIFAPLM